MEIMKPMETQASKIEKGEKEYLLDNDLVKPLPTYHKTKCSRWCCCKAFLITVAVVFFTFIFMAVGALFWVRHEVKRYTTDDIGDLPNPPLPVIPIPAPELEIVKDQAKLFWDQLYAGNEPDQDLVITQDHLNGFIALSDYLRGHAFVEISDGGLSADLVLPAHFLPGGNGRYFKGKADLTILNNTQGGEEEVYESHFETKITPDYHIHGMNFETLLFGKFLVYFGPRRKTDLKRSPILNIEYGQLLGKVIPKKYIDKRENLLNCQDHCDDEEDKEECDRIMTTLGQLDSISFEEGQIVFHPVRGNAGGGRLRAMLVDNVKVQQDLKVFSHFDLARRLWGTILA